MTITLRSSRRETPHDLACSPWLKPGGIFVASFGSGAAGEWTGEWLGNHNVLWPQQ